MKKGLSILALLAFCVGMFGVFAVTAGENPDGTLTVDKPAENWPAKKLNKDGTKKKPAVTFNHKKHGEAGCVGCHHTQADLTATAGTAESCFKCHGPEEKKTEAGKTQPDSYKMIHDKKIGKCLKCHNEEANKAAGAPTKCGDCHKK